MLWVLFWVLLWSLSEKMCWAWHWIPERECVLDCWKTIGILRIKMLDFFKSCEYFELLDIKNVILAVWCFSFGNKLKFCIKDFLNSCIEITWRCENSFHAFSLQKWHKDSQGICWSTTNTRGECSCTTTEVTKHYNLLSPVMLISTTTKSVRWFLVRGAIDTRTQNTGSRGTGNQQHVAIEIFHPFSTVAFLDQGISYNSLFLLPKNL